MEGYTKIGRIRPNYTGAWSAETAYTVLEMVKNEAGTASYIAKQDVPAGTPLTDETYWAMVLDAGDVIDAAERAASNANKAAQEYADLDGRIDQLSEEIADETAARDAAIARERNRAVAREDEIEALFVLPAQEAVDKWLDEHPEATTTVQDASLGVGKFTDDAIKRVVKDYATPEMFGAVGDGVSDDTAAIRACIDSGAAFVVMSKSYLTKDTIVVQGKSNLKLYLYGSVNYTGTDCAFRIIDCTHSDFIFDVITSKGSALRVESATIDSGGNAYKINRIDALGDGIVICSTAAGKGTQYHNFQLGVVRAVGKCINVYTTDETAWCGEIRVYGGTLTNNGGGGHGIYVNPVGEYKCTALRVFGVTFENLGCAIHLKNAERSSFYGCRLENANMSGVGSFVLTGGILGFDFAGDIIRLDHINIAGLDTTEGSTLTFCGVIRNSAGRTVGGSYYVPPNRIGYADSHNSNYGYYNSNEGDLVDHELFPTVIHIRGGSTLTLPEAYNFQGINDIRVLTEGVGASLRLADGTVLFTATHAYELHHLVCHNVNFLTWATNGWIDELVKHAG